MKIFSITILVLTSSLAFAINEKYECRSSNDPHMTNFNFNNFEFHQTGQFCMYQGKLIQVKSEFSSCSSGSQVTCNCMIRIETINGEFVEINTCNGNGAVQSTELGIPLDCSQSISVSSNLFDPAVWSSIVSNHNKFKCATTYADSLVIRTTLSTTGEDIMVKIDHISQSHIGQIRIYPSDNYIGSSSQYADKCLCGIKRDTIDREECTTALLNDCLQHLIERLSDEERAHVDKLIEECILDKRALGKNRGRIFPIQFPNDVGDEIQNAGLEVGHFQKDLIETTVFELLFKKYGSSRKMFSILRTYCECKKLRLNPCLIENGCKPPVEICIRF